MSKETACTGFTLVELLTVIAIIVLLIGLLFPIMRAAINRGKEAHTSSLINRLEAALKLYNSDWRDYPPSTDGGGGTLDDNAGLYAALISDAGTNGPYESFNEKDTMDIGGRTCLVDGWKHPLSYCHFTDYDPNWETNQTWRFGKKPYEFQLISAGEAFDTLDADHDGLVGNSELDGLNAKQIKKIVKNW